MKPDEMEIAIRKVSEMKGLPPGSEWVTFISTLADQYDLGLQTTGKAKAKPQWDAKTKESVMRILAERHLKLLLNDLRKCDGKFQDHTKCNGPLIEKLQ